MNTNDVRLAPNSQSTEVIKLTSYIYKQEKLISHLLNKVEELSSENNKTKLSTLSYPTMFGGPNPAYHPFDVAKLSQVVSSTNIDPNTFSKFAKKMLPTTIGYAWRNDKEEFYTIIENDNNKFPAIVSSADTSNILSVSSEISLDYVYYEVINANGPNTFSPIKPVFNNNPNVTWKYQGIFGAKFFELGIIIPASQFLGLPSEYYQSSIDALINNATANFDYLKIRSAPDQQNYTTMFNFTQDKLTPGLQIYSYIGNSSPYLYHLETSSNLIYGDSYYVTVYRLVWNNDSTSDNYFNYDVNIVYTYVGHGAAHKSANDDVPSSEWHRGKGVLLSLTSTGNTYEIVYNYKNVDNFPSNPSAIGGITTSIFKFVLDKSANGGMASAWDNSNGLAGVNANSLPYPYNVSPSSEAYVGYPTPLP